MSEPERWLKQARALSALERRLLESAERIAPPAGSKQKIWSALALSLPAPALPSTSDPGSNMRLTPGAGGGHGAGATSAVGAGAAKSQALVATSALKALAVGFALGAASVGTVTWLAPSESAVVPSGTLPPPIASQRATAGAPVSPRAAPGAELAAPSHSASETRPRQVLPAEPSGIVELSSEPAPTRVEPGAARAAFPDAVPAPAAAPAPTPSPSSNLLDRAHLESRRVAEARGRLRAGDPRGALGLLRAVASEFPDGVLVQEREALTIEALLACGERQAASERALDFVRRYPGSPHTSLVQRALQ